MACALLVIIVAYGVYAAAPCTYTSSDGSGYDLSALTLGTQYQTENGFLFNICGPVSDADCPTGSAACAGAVSLGSVSTQQFIDGVTGPDAGVTIIYTGGAASSGCPGGGERATVIYITCNTAASTAFYEFLFERPTCTYNFFVQSVHACPLATSSTASQTPGQTPSPGVSPPITMPCTYTAADGSEYNLAGLALPTQYENSPYEWNVCAPVADSGCPSGSAACYGSAVSLGELSTQAFSDGVAGPSTGVTITYGNGPNSGCPGGVNRQTVVNVACDATTTAYAFGYENPPCTYNFLLQSPHGCPNQSPAVVTVGVVGPTSLSDSQTTTLVAELNHPAATDVKVMFEPSGQAIRHADYTLTPGAVLTIPQGTMSASLTITCTTAQPSVHLTMYVGSTSGAPFATGQTPSFGFVLTQHPSSDSSTPTHSFTASPTETSSESYSTTETASASFSRTGSQTRARSQTHVRSASPSHTQAI